MNYNIDYVKFYSFRRFPVLQKVLGGRRFWGSVLSLAIPIAVQNLLTSSFTLVDTLMVGQLGDVSLAAVGMAGQWSWFLNMVLFGICSGASVFFAQYFGDKNHGGIVKTYGIAVSSAFLVSLAFLVVGLSVPKGVISIFNRDAGVLDAGSRYLKIAVFSYPAIVLNMIACAVLRSTKRVKLPMYVAFFTTIANAFLDYGLIFGAFGLPEMGIEGAAVATVISSWSGPVIIYIVMAIQKDDIFFAPVREIFGFTRHMVADFYKKALPVILNESLWGLGTICYNIIFANLGYEYSAAVTILRTFENIAFAFFVGFNNAGCVMVGQDIGAGNIKRALKDARRFMIIVPLAGVVVGIFVLFFREQLIYIFNMGGKITEKTLSAAMGIMLVYAIEVPIRNIPYVIIVAIFRSGGDTKTGMKYDLICLWAISLPVTFIAAFVIKLPFVLVFACSYVFEDYLKSVLCLKHFFSKKWIKPVTETGRAALQEYMAEAE
nr:MATE family efflux transporter [Congzhengia minquanensis]